MSTKFLTQFRDWAAEHAQDAINTSFRQLKAQRLRNYKAHLRSLPYFDLYQRYRGNPPLYPSQLQIIRSQILAANVTLRARVDEDWYRSCAKYPRVLDYYFSLVDVKIPNDRDPTMLNPRFDLPPRELLRLQERRQTSESRDRSANEGRRRQRRRPSRGRTPPAAPLPLGGRRGRI